MAMGTFRPLSYVILFHGDMNLCAETKQGDMSTWQCGTGITPNGVKHILPGSAQGHRLGLLELLQGMTIRYRGECW